MGIPTPIVFLLSYTAAGSVILFPFKAAYFVYDAINFAKKTARISYNTLDYLKNWRSIRHQKRLKKTKELDPVPSGQWTIVDEDDLESSKTIQLRKT